MCSVYILQSLKNNTYYIGSTNNLVRRLKEHKFGKSKYVKLILPISLLFSQDYPNLIEARRAELWLKKQKDKLFIEKIIKIGKLEKNFK